MKNSKTEKGLGAAVVRAGDSYEASVAKCKADAAEQGHVIIQDVGVPGVYEDIPRTIHAGYGVVAAELLEQCAPTHVLVNAGVGGFAAGVANTVLATKAAAGEAPPRLVTVEPAEADCLRRLATGDPEPRNRGGRELDLQTDCHRPRRQQRRSESLSRPRERRRPSPRSHPPTRTFAS